MSDPSRDIKIRNNVKVLVVNSLEEEYNPEVIQSLIEKNSRIVSWWNHFPGVWLVETELTPYQLSKLVYDKITGISCFATGIRTGDFSGRFSGAAWLWLLDVSEDEKQDLLEAMAKVKTSTPGIGRKKLPK